MSSLLEAVNHHAATAVTMRINYLKTKVMSAHIPVSSAKSSCVIVSPWRMLKNSSSSRVPKRSEAGLISPAPHSRACNPVFDHCVKYRCAQRASSNRQWCTRFYSTIAIHGLYKSPTKLCWWSLTMTLSVIRLRAAISGLIRRRSF